MLAKYQVDTGSDGNLLPVESFRKLFPNTTIVQLCNSRDRNVVLQTHNRSSITQSEMCKVEIKHTNKKITCKVFSTRKGDWTLRIARNKV